MINNIAPYLTNENIYLFANWGVLPLWLMLIFIPNNNLTKILVNSIFAPLLIAAAYVFLSYKIYLDGNIFETFNLYLGLENLYAIFSDENILLIFWLHFLSINLFVGNWIVSDAKTYQISKLLVIISLITTYFTGPTGLLIYWLFRIFYSRKINFYD